MCFVQSLLSWFYFNLSDQTFANIRHVRSKSAHGRPLDSVKDVFALVCSQKTRGLYKIDMEVDSFTTTTHTYQCVQPSAWSGFDAMYQARLTLHIHEGVIDYNISDAPKHPTNLRNYDGIHTHRGDMLPMLHSQLGPGLVFECLACAAAAQAHWMRASMC